MIIHNQNVVEGGIQGGGIFNRLLDKLPVELHIPGYSYCGPGSILTKNRKPINKLDEACRKHDYFYESNKELKDRHQADKILQQESLKRVLAKDSSWKEKLAALGVSGTMYAKRKLGLGPKPGKIDRIIKKRKRSCRKQNRQCVKKSKKRARKMPTKKITFQSALNKLRRLIRGYTKQTSTDENLESISEKVMAAGKRIFKKTPLKVPRVIGIPYTSKQGGALPLIPIISAISALTGLVSGATNVVKTVKNIIDAKSAYKNNREGFEETNVGEGLFVKPYRSGLGIYVRPYVKKN
jgi:hypothetical protein